MTNTVKLKALSIAVNAKNLFDKASVASAAALTGVLSMGITSSAETGSTAVIDLTGVDFSGLSTAITDVVPQILPVVVTICGIRKALRFVTSMINAA